MALVVMPTAFGQEDRAVRTIDPEQLHVLSEQSAREAVAVKAILGNAGSPINAATSVLPVWSYQVTAAQNKTRYTGLIVRQSPTSSAKATTTVPIVLIPSSSRSHSVALPIRSIRVPPIQAAWGSLNAFSLMRQSPLFNNASFTFNA